MFSLQNSSLVNKKILINCPNCHEIPFVFFNKTKPDHIQIKCNCSFNQSYPLHNYVAHFKPLNIKNIHQNTNNCICPNHPNSSFISFCETCKSHLCSECLSKHKQHKIIQLNVFFNQEKLKNIESNLKQAYSYLEEHNFKIKNNIVEALKNQINQIEDAYNENNTINKDILYFIKILLANYSLSPMNYYSISNLINNTQFNFKKIEHSSNEVSLSNIKKLVSFYKQNYIIKTDYIDINQFYINKTLTEHNSTVYTLIILSDGRLASCSWDLKIKIYNAITYESEITIEKAHQDYVNSITELSGNRLVSCSSDTSIKIWNIGIKDYNLITSFKHHSGVVFKVITLTNNRFASCSYDNLIKVYQAEAPYKEITTLTGHTGSVRCIFQIHNTDLLVSGSDDDTLIFWDLVKYEKVHEIGDISCSYHQSIYEIGNDLIAVGGYSLIAIVNYKTFCVQSCITDDYLNCVNCFLKLDDGNLLCGCQFGRMCSLNLTTFEWKFKKKDMISSCVTSLLPLGKRSFVASSYDKNIFLFEY